MKERKPSQCDLILAHLQAGNALTPLEALQRFNCFRLSGRVHDLKTKYGHEEIKSRTVVTPSGKHVAEYYIEPVLVQAEFVFT